MNEEKKVIQGQDFSSGIWGPGKGLISHKIWEGGSASLSITRIGW